jgi:hypothetical protein
MANKINIDSSSVKELKDLLISLNSQLEKTTDPKEWKSLSSDIDKVNKSLEGTNKALKEIDKNATFEEAFGDIKPLSGRLGELEDRMYEMALAGDTASESFLELQAEAAQMRQTIIRVDESVDALSQNRGIAGFGQGIKSLGASLLTLDFESASNQAKSLVKISEGLSFGTAIKGVKQLGSTFINLGKALLTNPLFLIAGVIALLVVAIVKLMDKIGLLKVIMEAVGKVFEWISDLIDAMIQPLKDLTDWLGWTSNAAEESAAKQAEAAEKSAVALEKSTESKVQSLDTEIKLREIAGEKTDDLEKQKLKQLEESSAARQKADKAAYDSALLAGELSEEEIKALKETARQSRLAHKQTLDDIRVFNAQRKQMEIDAINDRKDREEKARLDLNAGTLQGQKDILKSQRDQALEQEDLTYSERLLINQTYNTKVKEIETNDRNERMSRWKSYRDNRISAERELRDLEIESMEDGIDKELEKNKEKYERLIEDTKNSESLLSEEKKNIIAELEKAQESSNQGIIDEQYNIKLEKEKEFQLELNDLKVSANETEYERIAREQEAYDVSLKERLDKEEITLEQLNQLKLESDARYQEEKDALDQERADREAVAKAELDAVNFEGRIAQLELQREMELEQKDLTESEIFLIDQKYAEKRKKLQDDENARKIDVAKTYASSVNNLAGNIFAISNNLGKQDEKSKEERAKRQFKVQKALNLSLAVIDGIKAVQASIAQSPIAIGPIPNPAGIASLAFAVATSVANIAKIASSQYGGGAAGGPSGVTPPPIVPAPSSTSSEGSAVALNMFSNGTNNNNASQPGSQETNVKVEASISVDEVTNTQKNLANIEESVSN